MARKKKLNSDDIISVLGHRYVGARVGRYLLVPRTKKFTYLHKLELGFIKRILMNALAILLCEDFLFFFTLGYYNRMTQIVVP